MEKSKLILTTNMGYYQPWRLQLKLDRFFNIADKSGNTYTRSKFMVVGSERLLLNISQAMIESILNTAESIRLSKEVCLCFKKNWYAWESVLIFLCGIRRKILTEE